MDANDTILNVLLNMTFTKAKNINQIDKSILLFSELGNKNIITGHNIQGYMKLFSMCTWARKQLRMYLYISL